jgi:hypothetical protein
MVEITTMQEELLVALADIGFLQTPPRECLDANVTCPENNNANNVRNSHDAQLYCFFHVLLLLLRVLLTVINVFLRHGVCRGVNCGDCVYLYNENNRAE